MRRLLGWLCSAAPFVAAAIAALGDRHDARILWMAIVATLVVWIVVSAAVRSRGLAFAGIAAFVSASVAASGVAIVAGARAAFGVIAVAVVVTAFATCGAVLLSKQNH